jgi:hypothetical protein
VHASPNKFFFSYFIFWIFFDLHFAECFSLPSVFLALGKDVFADEIAAECPLPSVTLGKGFAECNSGFAECPRHSAKPLIPVVYVCQVYVLETLQYAIKRRHRSRDKDWID